jgi:FdhD protein
VPDAPSVFQEKDTLLREIICVLRVFVVNFFLSASPIAPLTHQNDGFRKRSTHPTAMNLMGGRMPGDNAGAVPVETTILRFDGTAPQTALRAVAVETPVNVVYGTVPYAVMMMTPGDFEDFAVGFSLTEGIVRTRADIRRVWVTQEPDGLRLMVDLVAERLHWVLARRRAMSGRTSCGVCGIEDLATLPRTAQRPLANMSLEPRAVQRALLALSAHQTLNDATRAVHAAAWAGQSGEILCVREDVGRHNALDKLIGALLTRQTDPAEGFLLVTSRCSYEMVEKAAAFGAGALVAISAPTSLGIERARHHGMTLVGVARADAMTVFSAGTALLTET